MIKSLEINNIQSHEHTKLDFVDGVNVIIGSSNQGKSAILRALYWLRTNRPLGIDNLASHWIVNDKGYLTNTMSVKIENDKGVVERRRTREDNQYIVNGNVLNVVKTDVPEQVSKLLTLSDTNVQKQLDSPFLLSQTSGEVAKYFNQMVNLDVIDKVLTNAESKRRKLKSSIENSTNEIENLENKIEELDWVDKVALLIENHTKLKEKCEKMKEESFVLDESIKSYSNKKEYIEWLNEFVENRKNIVNHIESSLVEIRNKKIEIDRLKASIENFESTVVYDFTKLKTKINRVDFIRKEINNSSIDIFKSTIQNYEDEMEIIDRQNKIINEYKNRLPNICPLCGSLLEGGKCVSC